MTFHLFDTSRWNATCDFNAAKAAGYVGVYLKATEGDGHVDPTFAERVVAAKNAGLHVGAYLFFHPAQNISRQVDLFINTVGDSCTLRPALDHETPESSPTGDSLAAVSACHLLQQHYGFTPLVYTYPSFISDGRCRGLAGYPLWLANYSADPVAKPPAVWSSWVMRQTGQAAVPGIAPGDGPGVDVDVAPSLTPLLIPTPKPVEATEMNTDDWKTMGQLIDAAVNKAITHVRNGPGYNLAAMQQEIADLKAAVAALPKGGGYGA